MLRSLAIAALLAVPARDDFEPPPTFEVDELLPPALRAGENFHVQDPVTSDGMVLTFRIASLFGEFEAYGLQQLAVRVHEIAAIAELR